MFVFVAGIFGSFVVNFEVWDAISICTQVAAPTPLAKAALVLEVLERLEEFPSDNLTGFPHARRMVENPWASMAGALAFLVVGALTLIRISS